MFQMPQQVFLHFDSRTVVMESKTSKECVTTHLPNGRQGCDAAFGVRLSEPVYTSEFACLFMIA